MKKYLLYSDDFCFFADSRYFEEFVDNEFNGDVSELDISDDEDADPNYQIEEALERVQSSSDDDSEPEFTRPNPTGSYNKINYSKCLKTKITSSYVSPCT